MRNVASGLRVSRDAAIDRYLVIPLHGAVLKQLLQVEAKRKLAYDRCTVENRHISDDALEGRNGSTRDILTLRGSVSHAGDRPPVDRKQCGESTRLSASIVLRLRAFCLIPTIDLMLRRM